MLLMVLMGSGKRLFAEGKDPALVKAAFVCNFTKFAEWPATAFDAAQSPIIVGVLGEDPFGSKLDSAAKGLQARGRPVVIKRFTTPPKAKECHLLFIGRDSGTRIPDTLEAVVSLPVLVVSDAKNFAAGGGGIGFVEKEGAIHFEINLPAAEGNGVKLNSGLLKLADQILKTSPRTKSP